MEWNGTRLIGLSPWWTSEKPENPWSVAKSCWRLPFKGALRGRENCLLCTNVLLLLWTDTIRGAADAEAEVRRLQIQIKLEKSSRKWGDMGIHVERLGRS